MVDRPLITLTLLAEPGVDGLRALRAALKILWRSYRLRCVRITCDASELVDAPADDVAGIGAPGTPVKWWKCLNASTG